MRSCTAPHCWLMGEGNKGTTPRQLENLHRLTWKHWRLLNHNLQSCPLEQLWQQPAVADSKPILALLFWVSAVCPWQSPLLVWGSYQAVLGSAKVDLQWCFFMREHKGFTWGEKRCHRSDLCTHWCNFSFKINRSDFTAVHRISCII